jgi:linoleoyl-CoA desaturase
MIRLKFSKDAGTAFYRELNEKLDEYFTRRGIARTGNRTMIFKIGMYFALDLIFYCLMISSTSVIAFYGFYLLMGISILLTAFNISHDAAHGVAVKGRGLNKFLFQLSFNLQGNNAYVWGKNHTESHHLFTNVEGSDIDVLNNPLVRMTDTQQLRWFHRFQHLYSPFLYLLYSLNWFLFRESLMIFNISSRTVKVSIPPVEVLKLVIFKIVYVGYMIALPIYVTGFGWQVVLLAFLLNHFLVSLIFVGVLGVAHLSDFVDHPVPDSDGRLSMSWARLQLRTSLDYNSGSRFLNWTLGGFNAHALHHLLPNVCHVHYLNVLPILRELCKKHGLVYMEVPYPQAIASHFRFLKAMGRHQQLNPTPFEG